MALNPFEQLGHYVAEPRKAFEDLVGILLSDCGLADGQVRIFCGDGGIDSYRGTFTRHGQLTVHQSKHFVEQWGDTQKQQIRDSFTRAVESDEFVLTDWILCIPVRPTRQDLHWFDEWREKKLKEYPSVKIDMLDGDDLTRMLASPPGARTRERFRDWGVISVRGGAAVLAAKVIPFGMDPKTGQTFRLLAQLTNTGDRTAESIEVRVVHSATQCVAVAHNSSVWDDLGAGRVNPRELRCKSDLHPGRSVDIIQIPLAPATPFPFKIAVQSWLKDQGSSRQFLLLQAEQLRHGQAIDLAPGELVVEGSADGGFVDRPLRWPQEDLFMDGLLMEIAKHPNQEEFGVADFGVDAIDTGRVNYRPHLAQSGMFWMENRAEFQRGIETLVNLGWLDPGVQAGRATVYRLSDAGKANGLFLYQVEELKKQNLF